MRQAASHASSDWSIPWSEFVAVDRTTAQSKATTKAGGGGGGVMMMNKENGK